MATPSVARLGHVGLHVEDLEKEKAFYRDIIGLTVTDEDLELGMVFMSARPEEEHHELLLCRGRNVGAERGWCSRFHFDATRSKTCSDFIAASKSVASSST